MLNLDLSAKSYGYIILIIAFIVFLIFSYGLFFSKILFLDTDNIILKWIREDDYYFLMSILFIPMAIWIIFWNWAGMKYFTHN